MGSVDIRAKEVVDLGNIDVSSTWHHFMLLFALLLGQGVTYTHSGLIEFSLGKFQEIYLIKNVSFEAILQNIPENVTYIIFQVHTQHTNTTISFNKISTRETSKTGEDTGLLLRLKPKQSTSVLYVDSFNQSVSASAAILPYNEKDPVPGGCNLGFDLTHDPNLYLQYNLYEAILKFVPANLGYPRGISTPSCDFDSGQNYRLRYDIYQYFMPENNLREDVIYTLLPKMAHVQQIEEDGIWLLSLSSQDKKSVTLSSIPGQGVIYNIIVRDLILNTSAPYIPVHTYACSFTAKMDNCYTLKRISTRILFVSVGFAGLFICFFGHRFLKVELFFIGFILSSFLFFVLITRTTSLDYDIRLGLAALVGFVGGSLLLTCWWRSGSVVFCMALVGLVFGFLCSSLFFFTPFGYLKIFHVDSIFWVIFLCVVLLVPLPFIKYPRALNITTCGFVGSYAVILAINSFVYTSLAYITLNIIKRALNDNFNTAYTNVPFQMLDYIMLTVWVVLFVSGVVLQFHRERNQPLFPSNPYETWKRDRERRQTNILDPSHHIPPLKERMKSSMTLLTQVFTKEPSAGESTPLLL
uniref:Transmembrane 7 superfamily member 3 n=1 Tax=Callorhinchus milii TaxID=7868 RepID=V9KEE9_CALMI